jgi:glutaredoxin 3
MASLIIYTKTNCFWCEEILDWLKEKGISFEERNVSNSIDLFKKMVDISGQNKAPVVIIDGSIYADTDLATIKRILEV